MDEDLKPEAEFEVQAISLDHFRAALDRNINVFKVNAESAELHILESAKATLAMDRPVMTLEVGDDVGNPAGAAS